MTANDLLDELHAFFMGLLAGHEELLSAAAIEFDKARAATPKPPYEVVERLDQPGNRASPEPPSKGVLG